MRNSTGDLVLDRALRSLKRIFKKAFFKKDPDEMEDPHSYVGAPKKPKPPTRSAAVAVELER
jgi:hypothetical protein